ncbi:uncharacterized protein V6R79_023576 [Siganus canaliculatus]
MVQTCSAYGCKNRYHKEKDISFHKFPLARPDICGKWVAAMRRNNFKPTKYSNICSQHFTRDCFKTECNNRVLKDNAVPSLFTFNLNIKSLEDPFPSEIHFPLSLPLTSDLVVEEDEDEEPERDVVETQSYSRSVPETRTVIDTHGYSKSWPETHCVADGWSSTISCDHNYTAEDSARQKKRIEQLEVQLLRLRKKLKTMQQKCRRQDRQLKRLKATCKTLRTGRESSAALGEEYVILPKNLYHTLKGVE